MDRNSNKNSAKMSNARSPSHGSSEVSENLDIIPFNIRNTSFSEEPKIADVFSGKTVLVTGATGFLGKVLVEKLLRSCTGIEEVLVLIRPSDKDSVDSRMVEFKKHRIFNRLREETPEALLKLEALTGDIVLENAGLSSTQLHKVTKAVSFVFHCAANVRFEDEASEILKINLLGVQNILELCKECEILEAFVHVSTAYAFCNKPVVAEQLYPESANPRDIIEAAKFMSSVELKKLCMEHVQGRPSLYPFSKAMAETFLVKSRGKVPLIIVRPSIVTASMKDPYPGWIDNYNGPSGFIHVCGRGVVKTLLVEPDVNADWVPVDIVANTLIAAAHYLVIKRKFINPRMQLLAVNEVPIINCTCPEENGITWMEIVNIILPFLRKYPSIKVYNMPGGTVTSSPIVYFMCRMTYHYLPALLVDLFSLLCFRKPSTISLYRRIHGAMSHLQFYTTRAFTFPQLNMRRLVEIMHPQDRRVFPIDQAALDWPHYMENYVHGVRRYYSEESDDTLPQARKLMMRWYYFWLVLKNSSACGILLFMTYLYKRELLKAAMTSSTTKLAMIGTKMQNARLQAQLRLNLQRNC